MKRKLLTREGGSLFSPLIDVVLNVLGAVFILLLLYLYLSRPHDCEPLRFLSTAPAPVIAGQSYAFTFPVAGGCAGERSFSVRGNLPEGLKLDTRSGTIFGVLLAHDRAALPLEVVVRDKRDHAAQKVSLAIYPSAVPFEPNPPFRLNHQTKALPIGRVGVPYEAVIGAVGGALPHQWRTTGVPRGLALAEGRLAGRPEVAGSFAISVEANFLPGYLRDGKQDVQWQGGRTGAMYQLQILPVLHVELQFPEGQVGEPYLGGIVSDGWLSEERVEWTGAVPGLRASGDGRDLFGSPSAAGSFDLAYRILRGETTVDTGHAKVQITQQEPDLHLGPAVFQAWEGEEVHSLIPYRGAREPVRIEPVDGLPEGLQIQAGAIVGIPRKPGLSRVRLTLRDARGRTAQGELIIRVGSRF